MSLLIKDLDIELCLFLEDDDLKNLLNINTYYKKLGNNKILWWKKLSLLFNNNIQYCDYKRHDLRDYYFELKRKIDNPDFINEIFDSMYELRLDIVYCIFTKKKLNVNYSFNRRYEITCEGSYFSPTSIDSGIWFYYPLNLAVKIGDYNLYKYLVSLNGNIKELYCIPESIDILKDLLYVQKIPINERNIYSAICKNKLEALILMMEYININLFEQVLDIFLNDHNNRYNIWLEIYNDSFSYFINSPYLIRYRNRINNSFDKLIIKYLKN